MLSVLLAAWENFIFFLITSGDDYYQFSTCIWLNDYSAECNNSWIDKHALVKSVTPEKKCNILRQTSLKQDFGFWTCLFPEYSNENVPCDLD